MDELEKFSLLPVETNLDLDVLAWWKARDLALNQPTQRVAAQRACRTWPRWRGSTSGARRHNGRRRAHVF